MPDFLLPIDVWVDSMRLPIGELVEKMGNGQFSPWDPRFQEPFWTLERQSRYIESTLLKIPLQPILFNASRNRDEKWNIIDGLQRLRTIANYMPAPDGKTNLTGEALPTLQGLQYFPELEGKTLAQAPRYLLRRFQDTLVEVVVIAYQTPGDAARNICERLASEQGLRRYQLFR